ncbi:hypothetical protein Tco_0881233 [Tanacetum coccineum]
MTQIDYSREAFKDDQYILVTQVKQVFYLKDKTKPHRKVVEHVNHKKFSDVGVIVIEDDPNIIHFDNSSDLPLSTSLNDLDNAALHIDGQSTVVDAPPDIIDVPDEEDYIISDEDALPHDLVDSDVEYLINVDDDADVARSYGVDGGGDDHPPSHVAKAAHGFLPLDRDHEGINQHLQKAYNTNKAAFKAQHWVIDTETGSYNVEKIRRARPEGITAVEWDKYIQFWNDPRNIARAAQNRQTGQRAWSYLDRDPGRLLTFEMRWQGSATQEYPSLIDTFFIAHTVDGVFTRDENRLLYVTSSTQISFLTFAEFGRGCQRGDCARCMRESADDQEDEDGDGDGDS